MSTVDSAVLTQILTQLESLQLSQQLLQAKVVSSHSFGSMVANNMSALSSLTP